LVIVVDSISFQLPITQLPISVRRHGHKVEVGRERRRRLLQRVHGVEVEWGRGRCGRRRRRRRCMVQEVGRAGRQRRLEAVGFVFGWSGRAVGVVRAAEK